LRTAISVIAFAIVIAAQGEKTGKVTLNAFERELGTMNLRQPAASLKVSKQR